MGDPGFVAGVIGVSIQMLVNIMIDLFKRSGRCERELEKLERLLRLNLPIYEEMQITAKEIGSLPAPGDGWLTQLKEIRQKGSRIVEAWARPPRWQIIRRANLIKHITQVTSDLRDHLASATQIILLQQFRIGVDIEQHRQVLESLKQSISSPVDVFPFTSSSTENDVDAIYMLLCFLRLATSPTFSEEVIYSVNAINYWIGEGLVAGRDHQGTGQTYVNMLADLRLIEPYWKDANGDVHLFRMLHQSANQIRVSQERFCDLRLNALLKVLIKSGTNLAIRDKFKRSSDPYVVAVLNHQQRKTGVKKKDLNPVWEEELSFSLEEPQPLLLKLEVYDKDTFSRDDPMGYGEVDLNDLARAARNPRTSQLPSLATRNTKGSCIECDRDGHMVQKVRLKLTEVESGELFLHIKWENTRTKR